MSYPTYAIIASSMMPKPNHIQYPAHQLMRTGLISNRRVGENKEVRVHRAGGVTPNILL